MKIAVIGGAGARVPLLVRGLSDSTLPIREIALYDIDRERLSLVAPLARRFARASVMASDTAAECVEYADFVFLSIRAGGAAARARDEAITLKHGIAGQETVGPGGFAMAMRNVPPALDYARTIEKHAPRAWVINFTNPVSIVTQALRTQSATRVVGICDTPAELYDRIAAAIGVHVNECFFEYVGLNHLGWVREVYVRGAPQMERLLTAPDVIKRIYPRPLFGVHFVQKLRLLPSDYLFYYYSPWQAFDNIRAAGRTRGEVVEALTARLFESLASPDADAPRVYEEYLAARDATYMSLETQTLSGSERAAATTMGGYDRIALAVVSAIHRNSREIITLNVSNNGNLPELVDEDVVEVPCLVDAAGAHPLHMGAVPPQVHDLVVRVKEYERLTVESIALRSRDLAERALARHPLVGDTHFAAELIEALGPLW